MTNMLPLKPYMFGHAAHLHKLVMDWRLLSGGQNDRKSGFKHANVNLGFEGEFIFIG